MSPRDMKTCLGDELGTKGLIELSEGTVSVRSVVTPAGRIPITFSSV